MDEVVDWDDADKRWDELVRAGHEYGPCPACEDPRFQSFHNRDPRWCKKVKK